MKAMLFVLWGIWDWIYYQCNRMEYVSKGNNLFRIVRKTYRGPELQTKSGKVIKSGDQILKLHIYNYGLAKEINGYDSNFTLAIYLRKSIEHSLEGLCDYIEQLPQKEDIKGIVGTSMLNRGANRLGFTIIDVQPTLYFWIKSFLYRFIYMLVHPMGIAYLRAHGQRLKSKHLVMSTEELMEQYVRREKVT